MIIRIFDWKETRGERTKLSKKEDKGDVIGRRLKERDLNCLVSKKEDNFFFGPRPVWRYMVHKI